GGGAESRGQIRRQHMPTTTASDRDLAQLEQMLSAHHNCISIVTQEENHALDLLTFAVARTGDPMWIRSATRGIYAGVFENTSPLPDTENAAAALYHFAHKIRGRSICVMLDLADHLEDARTRRGLRDVLHKFRETDSCLVLVDHHDKL